MKKLQLNCLFVGHRICCDDKNLYSFGGYNFRESDGTHNLYKEIFKYNFVRKSWTLLNEDEDIEDDCPEELASSAMAMHGKTLMIFGGTSYPFGIQCSNKVYLCNTNEPMKISKFQTANEPFENPPPQYGISIAYNQNHLYTVGGTEGYHYSADIHRLVKFFIIIRISHFNNIFVDSISLHVNGRQWH